MRALLIIYSIIFIIVNTQIILTQNTSTGNIISNHNITKPIHDYLHYDSTVYDIKEINANLIRLLDSCIIHICQGLDRNQIAEKIIKWFNENILQIKNSNSKNKLNYICQNAYSIITDTTKTKNEVLNSLLSLSLSTSYRYLDPKIKVEITKKWIYQKDAINPIKEPIINKWSVKFFLPCDLGEYVKNRTNSRVLYYSTIASDMLGILSGYNYLTSVNLYKEKKELYLENLKNYKNTKDPEKATQLHKDIRDNFKSLEALKESIETFGKASIFFLTTSLLIRTIAFFFPNNTNIEIQYNNGSINNNFPNFYDNTYLKLSFIF